MDELERLQLLHERDIEAVNRACRRVQVFLNLMCAVAAAGCAAFEPYHQAVSTLSVGWLSMAIVMAVTEWWA